MEILKIHASKLAKHGDIDYEAVVKVPITKSLGSVKFELLIASCQSFARFGKLSSGY
jgi:hypothetical protein